MKLCELMEGRADFLLQQRANHIQQAYERDTGRKPENLSAREVIDLLNQIHPKYIVWITNQYIRGQFKLEDADRLRGDIQTFDKIKQKLPNKDLNSYKSLTELYDAIESVTDIRSKREQKAAIKHEGAKAIIDHPNFKVFKLLTHEAACHYGANTKWCTASKNNSGTFDDYANQGDIFVIIAKDPNTNKDRKFQLHFESNQFMDERDQSLGKKDIKFLSSFPEYKIFLEHLIQKHHSEHIT